MKTIYYSVPDHGTDRYSIKVPETYCLERTFEQKEIAERCAQDCFYEIDGWGRRWPLVFVLYATADGDEVAKLLVDMEAEPMFTAVHIAQSKGVR